MPCLLLSHLKSFHFQFGPACTFPLPPLKKAQNYASITVYGEVIARDHNKNLCLLAIWQNVCNMHFQSFYIHAIFKNDTDCEHTSCHGLHFKRLLYGYDYGSK